MTTCCAISRIWSVFRMDELRVIGSLTVVFREPSDGSRITFEPVELANRFGIAPPWQATPVDLIELFAVARLLGSPNNGGSVALASISGHKSRLDCVKVVVAVGSLRLFDVRLQIGTTHQLSMICPKIISNLRNRYACIASD